MKNFLTFSLIIIFNITFSQNNEVVYELIPAKYERKSENTKVNDLLNEMEVSNENYILNFIMSSSSFVVEKQLSEENLELGKELNRARLGYYPLFYSKEENTFYVEKNGVIVKKINEIEWEITKESKKIDNYICYKAICKEQIINRLGEEKTREIVAWFTPELPYSYGPLEYNGLPGLILELEKLGSKLVAKKITIDNDKTIEIEKPKGKIITEEEYEKKVKQNFE